MPSNVTLSDTELLDFLQQRVQHRGVGFMPYDVQIGDVVFTIRPGCSLREVIEDAALKQAAALVADKLEGKQKLNPAAGWPYIRHPRPKP